MKAVQITATGGTDVLQVSDIPKPVPAPDEILVKVAYSGINYIDIYHRNGDYKLPLPSVLGREASGIVEAVGDKVTKFVVGDPVAMLAAGTYAEYFVAKESRAFKLPNGVSLEIGASVYLQGATALALVKYAYPVTKGEYVLIHAAAGGTGQVLSQVLREEGAIVIGTTSTEAKAEKLRSLGYLDHVIVNTTHDFQTEVLRLTNGQGVHVCFDGVGRTTFQKSLASIRKKGSLVVFGSASGQVADINIACLVPRNIRLSRMSLFELMQTDEEYEFLIGTLFNYLAHGKIKIIPPTIYSFEKVAESHIALESGKTVGKLLLKVD